MCNFLSLLGISEAKDQIFEAAHNELNALNELFSQSVIFHTILCIVNHREAVPAPANFRQKVNMQTPHRKKPWLTQGLNPWLYELAILSFVTNWEISNGYSYMKPSIIWDSLVTILITWEITYAHVSLFYPQLLFDL